MHNGLIDNSKVSLQMVGRLKELISDPKCTHIYIATGYWDLPGTNLLYEELKAFLARGGTLQILIGQEPTLLPYQRCDLPQGKKFPDFYIAKDLEKLSDEYKDVGQMLVDHMDFKDDKAAHVQVHIYGKDENAQDQFLHAKSYILTGNDFAYAFVGSSNFTQKGLEGNAELNTLETNAVMVTAPLNPCQPSAKSNLVWFEEKWANSRPWNGRFLSILKAAPIWKKLRPRKPTNPESAPLTPYEVYIKLLQHRYGAIVDTEVSAELDAYLPTNMLKLDYQKDAVKQCFAALKNRGGFMLADVVGLGKTIVAALVMRRFQDCPEDRPAKILVVTPPAVKSAWVDTLDQFGIPSSAVDFVTTGSIGQLLEGVPDESDGMDEEADSGDFSDELKNENYGLIIIDESHRFRNSTTAMYSALDDLIHKTIDETGVCPYIGLLSATPQNNSPRDIKNQIYLFARDRKHSAFDAVPDGGNLEAYFSAVEKKYAVLQTTAEALQAVPGGASSDGMAQVRKDIGKLAQDVRDKVLDDVLVRRTRTDVQKYYTEDIERQHLHFPSIKGPNELEYVLTPRLARLFSDTMDTIAPEGEFRFGNSDYLCYFRYQAVRYLKDAKDKDKYKFKNLDAERFSEQLAHIMQMLLVKRLESSFSAFRESLLNLRRYTENMVAMWEANTIFVCPQIDVNKEFEKAGNNIRKVQATLRAKIAKLDESGDNEKGRNCEYRRSDFDANYIKLIKKDLKKVSDLYDRWAREVNVDPKLDEFKRRLPELMSHPHNIERKLVIFSEAKATVDALYDVVESCGYFGRVLKITAKNRKEMEPVIKANFDANHAGEWKNDYDIIITTEVLAEGVNLHRANFILNYDAPWNATRLMQRIGRVNRIGTKADFIYVYNFMPSAEGDQYIGLVSKAYVKLQSFQSLLGEDSKIFTNAETVETHELNTITSEDEESAFAPYIAELKEYKGANPVRYAQIVAAPCAEAAVADDDASYFTVAPPHGAGLFVRVQSDGEANVVPLIEMLAACKVEPAASASEMPADWDGRKEAAITAYIHYQAPVKSYFKKTKAAKSAMLYADRFKGDPSFGASKGTKKLLTIAKKLVDGGNVDVTKKLNALGERFFSDQMELLPVTSADVNDAIHEALAAIAEAHEAHKGQPHIITGLAK